jgi:hypothetical protein
MSQLNMKMQDKSGKSNRRTSIFLQTVIFKIKRG